MEWTLVADMAARAAVKTAQDYHGATVIHPLGIGSLLVLGAWLLVASRKTAMLPLMILICFIPSSQRIVIAGADFTLLRLMVLFGLARITISGELTNLRPNKIDWVYFAWVVVGGLVYVIQRGDLGAVVYVCGVSMDMLGAYAVTRALVRNADDVRAFGGAVALTAVFVSVFFAVEATTGRNMFSAFGGVPSLTVVRDGRLRCQGAFAHPILAGVFWAAMERFSSAAVWGPSTVSGL